MKIVTKQTNELINYANNPRVNDQAVDSVALSIKEFGFKVPIIITKDNVIVAGHTRLKAAKKLNLLEVPCIIADDLTDDQIKAFRLADNKTSELSDWDFSKLEEELGNIDMDMIQFGFEELEEALPDSATDDDFDVDSELPEVPFSEQGDIYILGKHRLMCGDSTKAEDVEKLVDNNKVDMIFTDPPYNVDYEGSAGKIKNDKMENDSFYLFLLNAFTNMFESIKPGGSIYVCHADTEGLNFRNAYKNAGFKLAECLIWVKNALVLGRQDYHWRHEPILYGWKEGAGHYFVDDRSQDTVWEYNKPKKNDVHPTMKPLELVGQAISNSSRRHETVLDLFGGSGSTLIASEQLDRKSCLMEFDEKFVDVIVKRYIKEVETNEDCYLIRNGKKVST
jgi:DNA modification methylase